MPEICQKTLPFRPWSEPDLARLPGMRPVSMADWLVTDDAHAPQMAERDRLLGNDREAVLAPASIEVGAEILETLLGHLPAGYRIHGSSVERPDGGTIALDGDDPLAVAARLVQEDICVLEEVGDEYHLTAGALLFPASWTLAEKLNRPMTRIHAPVDVYDTGIAARVHRLFSGLRPMQPLMRANALLYDAPDLFHPRREADDHKRVAPRYLRMERQCLVRLPKSRAVCFTIHTYVLRLEDIPTEDRRALGIPIG